VKWKIIAYIAAVFLICGEVYLEDGYFTPNGLVCRNPFCQTTTISSCSSVFNVYVVTPVNGSNFYFPVVTPNVTVSIIGYSGPVNCYYQIGGLWNTFNHCAVGENMTWDLVTLPEGYPVDIVVNITTGCGEVLNATKVNVWYQPGYSSGDDIVMVILLLFGLSWIFWRYRRKRRIQNERTRVLTAY
jgi:hypothetical protein